MKLNEAEMRMAYQIESTDPNAVLNEIYMTWRLSKNQATRDTAESLMAKLRPLSNKECMDLIREVQANYRLPGKPQTIGEMLAEARQKSGARTGSWGPLSTPFWSSLKSLRLYRKNLYGKIPYRQIQHWTPLYRKNPHN